LGLGLPWVYATLYEESKFKSIMGETYEGYFVPAASLGFNVIVFSSLAIICLIFLMIRRKVVGGELGGSDGFRTFSCVFLVSLWCIYIIVSILKIIGVFEVDIGIDLKYEYKNRSWLTCKY